MQSIRKFPEISFPVVVKCVPKGQWNKPNGQKKILPHGYAVFHYNNHLDIYASLNSHAVYAKHSNFLKSEFLLIGIV